MTLIVKVLPWKHINKPWNLLLANSIKVLNKFPTCKLPVWRCWNFLWNWIDVLLKTHKPPKKFSQHGNRKLQTFLESWESKGLFHPMSPCAQEVRPAHQGSYGPMGVKNPLRGRLFTWKKNVALGGCSPVNSQDPKLHQFLPTSFPPKEIAGRCCCWNLFWSGCCGRFTSGTHTQKFDEWMDTAPFPCICHGCR